MYDKCATLLSMKSLLLGFLLVAMLASLPPQELGSSAPYGTDWTWEKTPSGLWAGTRIAGSATITVVTRDNIVIYLERAEKLGLAAAVAYRDTWAASVRRAGEEVWHLGDTLLCLRDREVAWVWATSDGWLIRGMALWYASAKLL